MKKRSSNIELLRITAMIMIIAYHLFLHCIKAQLTDSESIAALGNDCFCIPIFQNDYAYWLSSPRWDRREMPFS